MALRKAIDPWIGWYDADGEDAGGEVNAEDKRRNRARESAEMITVLENPTLNEVSETARRTCFTHVHVACAQRASAER